MAIDRRTGSVPKMGLITIGLGSNLNTPGLVAVVRGFPFFDKTPANNPFEKRC